MRFLLYHPAPPLDQCVDFFWYYDGLTPAHRLERVLPEGRFELLINLHEEPRHTFDPDRLNATASFRGSWIAGMHSQPVVIDTAANSSMIGIHFRPGGAGPLLGIPASELCDQIVHLDTLWGTKARHLRNQLLEAPSPDAKFHILEEFLQHNARFADHLLLAHAICILQTLPEEASIRKTAAELGWSHKHLIGQFQQVVGMSPKRFSRVQRFQRAVRTLQRSPSAALTDLALECGYYDQAHFNTEFKIFSGLTPTQFVHHSGGRENFIPIG